MTEKIDNRNYFIDFVKGIACIFIILMHVRFPAPWRTLMLSTMRFAVPFFFMVSGYFTYSPNKESRRTACKKVKHILKIVIGASILYVLFAMVQIVLGVEKLQVNISDQINWTFFHNGPLDIKDDLVLSKYSLATWFLFNVPTVISPQMWFLFALLYVYIIYLLLVNKISGKMYAIIPLLWGGYVTLAQIAFIVGYDVSPNYYRNWLFLGLPFFFAGRYIHEHKITISNKILVWVMIISTIFCPVEMMLFGRVFGVHLSSFPQVLSIFLLSANNPQMFKNNAMRIIGTKYSLFVYVLHPFVWHSAEDFYDFIGISDNIIAQYAMPLIVIIFTIALSIIVEYIIHGFSHSQAPKRTEE